MNENNKQDQFQWIKDIIHTNVVSKLKGSSYANIIDMGSRTGSLIKKLKEILPDSRFFAYSIYPSELKNDNESIRFLSHDDLKSHNYDLILSVFDLHSMNVLEIDKFLSEILDNCDPETTIVLSDIESKSFWSSFLLSMAKFFNPRIKTILGKEEIAEKLELKGFQITDKDSYKINNVWSAWIFTCRKSG